MRSKLYSFVLNKVLNHLEQGYLKTEVVYRKELIVFFNSDDFCYLQWLS